MIFLISTANTVDKGNAMRMSLIFKQDFATRGASRTHQSLELKAEVAVKIKPPQYEAFVVSKTEPIFRIFDQVYRQVMGVTPLYEYAGGITDANIFAGEGGIPCLHLGPERGGAHQKNEYVPLEWLPPLSEMYARIAARFFESD